MVIILISLNATNLYVVANYLLAAQVVYAISVVIYFWTATYGSSSAKDSAVRVLKGSIAPAFWVGVVLLGIVLPIVMIAPFSLKQNVSQALFVVSSAFTIIGGVALRYVILKAGMYSPLLTDE